LGYGKDIPNCDEVLKTDMGLQEFSVKEENMTVTVSHMKRNRELVQHGSTGFCLGARVVLHNLKHTPVAYGDDCWTNPSLLDGSTGTIIRREKDVWIVELDNDFTVRIFFTMATLKTLKHPSLVRAKRSDQSGSRRLPRTF
jgi:hypothetical protein